LAYVKFCVHDARFDVLEKELTNMIGQLAKLFKCDWSIRSSFKILERFLAWTQGFTKLRN